MGAPVRNHTSLTGMKKWLADYRAKRPGLAALQKAVDDFMAEFDAREEKAKVQRMAAAQEEGWTLVTGNKGRKKTVDAESGVRVGAVSSLAVEEKAKTKTKESAVDFYRFQRREAKRNEVLELQKKFEEDKKRIAKMREARKFRPY
ncbi:hypothetical protein R1flu_017799 [Riccia fluitans]|uniref:Ribosomal RNA-processing protein 7 C-terminal domain-containing protein n=1 Tax=Riccia fluitans TaxID=41844 RepID=A0ABD1ZGB8_9MARC